MKFYIDQHGCAKNQVDGEEIVARLEALGHTFVDASEPADLIIINTCGFIEDAKRESIEAILQTKTAWPGKKLMVAGCLAQRYPQALLEDIPEVDAVFGNADLARVAEAVDSVFDGSRRSVVYPQPKGIDAPYYPRPKRFDYPGSAYVKITEGCDNHCSYCAIPLIRGSLRSRGIEDILAECRGLITEGVREINLIGQDLRSYGKDFPDAPWHDDQPPSGLPFLLDALTALPGACRFRILYIHPDHFPWKILGIMQREPRILPYFDLPFQHASEKVLRKMNRKGSATRYLDLISKIRDEVPASMIRSTFLVGFPGETEEDFDMLLRFQEDARLDWLGVFAYSREEGTPAYSMKERITRKLSKGRKKKIEIAQEAITPDRLRRFLGEEIDVLVEETVEGSPLCLGRGWMQAPEVDGLTVLHGAFTPGSVVRSRIIAVNGLDFEAEPLGGTA